MDKIAYEELNLPDQLKHYLRTTKCIYENLDFEVLEGIEETYIVYSSLYYFDRSHFSLCVIDMLKNDFTSKNFNNFLDKKLVKELSITSKNTYNYSFDSISTLNNLFHSVMRNFIESVNSTDNKNFKDLYKQIGKAELVNQIVDEENYKNILKLGLEMVEEIED